MSFFLNSIEMSLGDYINSLGLMLDIVGAILIFKYGIPEKINREGEVGCICLESGGREEEKEKERLELKRYDKYSKTGLILLIIGFSLQLLSNFIN